MNFKEEYKKENESITPSDSFLTQLQSNLDNEAKRPSVHPASFSFVKLAVAAIFIGIVAVSVITFPKLFSNHSASHDSEMHAGSSAEATAVPNQSDLSAELWYPTNSSSDEIVQLFTDMMNGTDLKKLFHNDSNTFSNDNLVTEEELSTLLLLLSNVGASSDSPSDYIATDYYMAVFTDGTIIKFTMNSEYLFIPDANIYIQP